MQKWMMSSNDFPKGDFLIRHKNKSRKIKELKSMIPNIQKIVKQMIKDLNDDIDIIPGHIFMKKAQIIENKINNIKKYINKDQ